MNILVSACLLGFDCRYCGGGCASGPVLALAERFRLVPVCPEQMGGLPTPRPPAELRNGRVVTSAGRDVTASFEKGAREALKLARLLGCRCAVLKSRSPSCGSGSIYNGTFSGTLTPGDGVTAALLREAGVTVFDENSATAGLTALSREP